MRKVFLALLLGILCSVWGSAQNVGVAARLGYPQMILYNGKIVTMDDSSFESRVGTITEAMAVWDGKVLATGSNADIRALAKTQTKLIDLKGKTVVPGFTLTHDHPTDWAFQRPLGMTRALPNDDIIIHRWLPSVPPKQQLALFEPTLKEAVAKAKPGQWIFISFNWGKDYEWSVEMADLFEKSIKKEYLDQLAPNHPVKVKHGLVFGAVNQRAIDELKAVHPTLDVMGPTPEAAEQALKRVGIHRPVEPDAMFKGKLSLLAKVLEGEMSIYPMAGVTTIASSVYAYNNLQALDYLDKRGEMPIRFAWGYPGPDWSQQALRYLAGMMGHGTDHLWLTGAFAAFGSNCMSVPARESVQEAPVSGDIVQTKCSNEPGTPGRKILEDVVRNRLRIATIHTGGDKDIDYYMDAIEKASREAGMTMDEVHAMRHVFDHSGGAPRPDQILRMKNLGMMASLNNFLLWKQDGLGMMSTSTVAKHFGVEYTAWVSPRNSMTKAGVMSSWEIDRPLHDKLFFFILKGITRYNDEDQRVYAPGERTDRIIQLKAITRWGAGYTLRENLQGSLEAGKFADFAVLDRDYLTIPEEQIADIKVLMTVTGGKVVHLTPVYAREVGLPPAGPTSWNVKLPEGW